MGNSNNNSAKFAFFYLLSLVALIFMAVSVGMIIFQIINKTLVDAINQYRGRYSVEALKFAISALIISAPIFYATARQIYKNLFSGGLDKDSPVRKWLTYFILLVSSVIMLGWLIGTINSFLDGELTTKFILKALTAIGLAAAIFSFYFYDIKREEVVGRKDKIIKIYFYGSLAVVVAVFISALFFVESPRETRDRKLDQAILNNFQKIDNDINRYYNEYNKLPKSLGELKSEYNYLIDRDLEHPATGEKFEYKIVGDNKYELCTTFRTSNKDDEKEKYMYYEGWLHDAGYQCLNQKARDDEVKKVPARRAP